MHIYIYIYYIYIYIYIYIYMASAPSPARAVFSRARGRVGGLRPSCAAEGGDPRGEGFPGSSNSGGCPPVMGEFRPFPK